MTIQQNRSTFDRVFPFAFESGGSTDGTVLENLKVCTTAKY
jgi:hypothetical protein